MIGLVDFDLQTSTSTSILIPNLEIMKLATYYKTEERQYCRLIGLNEKDLDNYDKIYFFSEHNNKNIPMQFLSSKNVVFGGTAFTKQIYIPFENSLIDFTIPRPAIYKEFLQEKYTDGIKSKVITHVLDDAYYRIYAGKDKLPIPPIHNRKRIFLFDRNIFYPDWQQIMQNIAERNPSAIMCTHPITCRTLTQYFNIRNCEKFARTNIIILDLNIPLEETYYMFKEYKNLFLADIMPTSNIFLPIGGTYHSTNHYGQDLIYKLQLLYCFWSHKIPIKLLFIEPEMGINNPLANLEKLTAIWAKNVITSSEQAKSTSLEKRILANKGKKIEAKEYEKFLGYFPKAKTLFKYTYNQIFEGGIWRL